jgi:hypothetical protein
MKAVREERLAVEREALLGVTALIFAAGVGVPAVLFFLFIDKNLLDMLVSLTAAKGFNGAAVVFSSLVAVVVTHMALERLGRWRRVVDAIALLAVILFVIGMSTATGWTVAQEIFYNLVTNPGPTGSWGDPTTAATPAPSPIDESSAQVVGAAGQVGLAMLLLLSIWGSTIMLAWITSAVKAWSAKRAELQQWREAAQRADPRPAEELARKVELMQGKLARLEESAVEMYAATAEQAIAPREARLKHWDAYGQPGGSSQQPQLPHDGIPAAAYATWKPEVERELIAKLRSATRPAAIRAVLRGEAPRDGGRP